MADSEKPEIEDRASANIALAASLTLVDRSLGRLISAVQELDEIQKTAMSVGVRSNTAMNRMGDTIKNHPGGMKNAFQSALSFMQVGLMKHSRGMLHLAQVTKATGQDIAPIISGFAKLGSVMPLSAKAMGNLGNHVVELSQTWGIQTGALMKVLEKHADTISRLAALGGDPEKASKAITDATSRAGVLHQETVGMLAKKFTFEGGGDDLMKAVVQMGGRQDLVQRMRTEDMSAELLAEINNAILKTYDEQVAGRTNDRYITSLIAKGLTFDVGQIGAMRAFKNSFENGQNLIQRGLKDIALNYSQSIGTMKDELFAPIQTSLIPAVELISWALSAFRTETGNVGAFISTLLVRLVFVVGTIAALAKIRNMIQWRELFTGKTLWGAIIGGIVSLTWGIVELASSSKKIAENKENTDRANRELAMKDRRVQERYITGAMIAASLTNQSLARTSTEKLEKLLERANKYLEKLKPAIEEISDPSKTRPR